jgi:hypothetical protein
MRDPALQAIVFAGWTIGVPALTGGLFFEVPHAIAAGGWAMLAATAVSAIDSVAVVGQAIRKATAETAEIALSAVAFPSQSRSTSLNAR